jgi:cobalt/nickel transport protein
MSKMSNKKLAIILLIIAALIAFVPFFALKGAEFGGSDDAGSVVVSEVSPGYEPWFEPIMETLIGGELPGEIESLLFCLQTGIGVGILAFFIGRFYERSKLGKADEEL